MKCRKVYGMTIENRQRTEGEQRISEYRYVPSGQISLFRS